jgi:hypothetical protein
VAESSSHPSSSSSSVEGLATGSMAGSDITPHTFQSSPLSTGTSKNRHQTGLRREVEELLQLHGLIEGRGGMEGAIRAASTIESDGKFLDGSLSHPGLRGSASVTESSHTSSASSSVEGSGTGSTTASGIPPHTFQSSTLSTETSKNRHRAGLRREVAELLQLHKLIEGGEYDGCLFDILTR